MIGRDEISVGRAKRSVPTWGLRLQVLPASSCDEGNRAVNFNRRGHAALCPRYKLMFSSRGNQNIMSTVRGEGLQ